MKFDGRVAETAKEAAQQPCFERIAGARWRIRFPLGTQIVLLILAARYLFPETYFPCDTGRLLSSKGSELPRREI